MGSRGNSVRQRSRRELGHALKTIPTAPQYVTGRKATFWAESPMTEDLGPAPAALKSAARVLRIFEFFDEIRRSARENEIAERLKFPQSSASMLLNSMVRLGYLDFDPATKGYLPSIRAAVLATWRDTGCFRDGSMYAALENLSAASGLAACLTVRNGIFTRYLHVVQTIEPGAFHITLAARRYAVQSAAGIVLMTKLGEREITQLVHRTRAEDNPKLKALTLGEVNHRIMSARADGYYASLGLVMPETGAVAVALPSAITGGWQEMALSLAGHLTRIESRVDHLATLLARSVRELESAYKPEQVP